jgi:hypothetical protein
VIFVIVVGAKHWPRQYGNHNPNICWPMLRPAPTLRPRQYGNHNPNIYWPMLRPAPTLRPQKFGYCRRVWAKHSPILIIRYIIINCRGGQGEAFPNINCRLYQKLSWGMLSPYGYDGYAIALSQKHRANKSP